jgi:hypothetical protein
MGLYRIKKGSHTSGTGVNLRFYRWNDPENNIIESDSPLNIENPEKFEEYHGKKPVRGPNNKLIRQGEIAPPGPPDVEARNAALAANPRNEAERQAKIKELQAQIEALEAVEDGEEEDTSEEASTHVREAFAKSDAASEFEKKGKEQAKRLAAAEEKSQAKVRKAQAAAAEEEESEVEEETEGEETEEDAEDLESKSVGDLKKLAEAEEIDLGNARSKADVLKAIKKARQG